MSAGPPQQESQAKDIWVPIKMEAYTRVGEALVNDIHALTHDTASGTPVEWHGSNLPAGRFADLSKLVKLEPDEVEHAIRESIISFGSQPTTGEGEPPYNIDDSGSLAVRLSPSEFILNEQHFMRGLEERITLLRGGRAIVARQSDHLVKDPDAILPDFLLGGIRLSAGPHYWRVLKEISPQLHQLESAALFDANRLMGIGRHLPEYDQNRQVELRRIPKDQPFEHTYRNTWPGVEFYRSAQVGTSHAARNWIRMTPEARRSTHEHGITALQALETANPANRSALFSETRRPEVAALVLSRRGVQVVPETGSPKLNTYNTISTLQKGADGIPEGLQGLGPLIEDLGMAGDRTATVIAKQVRIRDLSSLVSDGDARAVLFEQFRKDGSEAMTTEELSSLVDLSRRGIGIAWAQDGDYREFHPSGLWIKPGVAQRIENLEMTVAMFGARRERVGLEYQGKIGQFLNGLVDMFEGPEHLAVVHGNGSGIMRVADEGARERNMLSFGVGIDVERLGQNEVNKDADGRMNMESSELLMRQHLLEVLSSVPVFTEGGIGTFVELYNSLCFRKLLLGLPTPIIVVDPKDMYKSTREQIEQVSNQGNGEPRTPRHWLKNILRFVPNFEEAALAEIKNFRESPMRFWDEAKIPHQHIKDAHRAQELQLTKLGMRLPPFMQNAVKGL